MATVAAAAACGLSITGQPTGDLPTPVTTDASIDSPSSPGTQDDARPSPPDGSGPPIDGSTPPDECISLLNSVLPFQLEGTDVQHLPGVGVKVSILKNKTSLLFTTFTSKKGPFTKSRVDVHLAVTVAGEWGDTGGDYAHLLRQHYGTDRDSYDNASMAQLLMAQGQLDAHVFAPEQLQIKLEPPPALLVPTADTHVIVTTNWGTSGALAITVGADTKSAAARTASSPLTDKLTVSIGGGGKGNIPTSLELLVKDVCVSFE